MVKEITVVRYGNHRAGILLQMLFEPVDAFCVKVVGRLVKQQNVGLLQQQTAQSHTTTLAAAQGLHRLVVGRTTQSIHGPFKLIVYVPRIAGI